MMRIISAFLLALAAALSHAAEEYPSKLIRMIVPAPPGNSSDIYARFFAEKLSTILKQTVIVENRVGGNGFIGTVAVKQAPADGYTVLVAGSSPMAMNVGLYKQLPYNPAKDFRWVSGMLRGMSILVVPAESRFMSVRDLVAEAKSRPLALNYGSYAAAYRLATEWFAQMAGFRVTHVPYKGAPQVVGDLMGRQIDFAMADAATVLSLIKAGRLRALAVSGDERHPSLPDTPTIKESGFPAYMQYQWVSLAVHADTPDAAVKKLSEAMLQAMATPEAQAFSEKQGSMLMPIGPEQMLRFGTQEIEKYKRIASEAGIEPE